MNKNKKILLVASLLGVTAVTSIASQEVKANEVESSADVTLSKGIRLTEVPNFDFGTVIYNGDATSYTLTGANLGDKNISWFDGTPSNESAKVYASITDVPQELLKDASIEISYDSYSSAIPRSEYWYISKDSTINFNGEKNLIVDVTRSTSNSGQLSYLSQKSKNNVTDFKFPNIKTKKINLPAGLQSENMTMTVNWDIESSPE
ncbi:hypothetical protein J5K75_002490 [Enterococcus faecalis]|nr:hypothetical protein [Enterococcus faecalis]HAP2807592.1 hypothetical protein [Enterococcus faecalis]